MSDKTRIGIVIHNERGKFMTVHIQSTVGEANYRVAHDMNEDKARVIYDELKKYFND